MWVIRFRNALRGRGGPREGAWRPPRAAKDTVRTDGPPLPVVFSPMAAGGLDGPRGAVAASSSSKTVFWIIDIQGCDERTLAPQLDIIDIAN